MTWKGISPIVRVLDKVFETGVKVAKKEFTEFQKRITRNPLLPKWDVQIQPACKFNQLVKLHNPRDDDITQLPYLIVRSDSLSTFLGEFHLYVLRNGFQSCVAGDASRYITSDT